MTRHLLPAEVLSQIFEETHNLYDLCSASLASSAFRHEAQRILFRNPRRMVIGHDVLPRSKFLDAIITSPNRLAPAVQSFELEIHLWHLSLRRHKVSMFEKLHHALLLMVNLKTLAIWAPSTDEPSRDPSGPLPHILRDCTFQLASFLWGHAAGDELLLIREFLPTQRRLTALSFPHLISEDDELIDSASALNLSLESLRCPSSLVSALLRRADKQKPSTKFLRWTFGSDKSVGTEYDHRLSKVLLLHSDIDPIGRMGDGPLVRLASSFANVTLLSMHTTWLNAPYMMKVTAILCFRRLEREYSP